MVVHAVAMSRTDDALDALYARLPEIDCQGFCHDSCGPIDMAEAERDRIRRVHRVEIGKGSFLRDGPSDCPALTMFKKCGVYEVRPLICRIWGLTRRMPCNYGCRPSRWVTEQETYTLLAEAFELSGQHEDAALARQAADSLNAGTLTTIRDVIDAESRRRWGG